MGFGLEWIHPSFIDFHSTVMCDPMATTVLYFILYLIFWNKPLHPTKYEEFTTQIRGVPSYRAIPQIEIQSFKT